MGYPLSPEDKACFEAMLAKAEPYPEDDPIFDTFDGKRDMDRAMATIAKMALEGDPRFYGPSVLKNREEAEE